MHILSGCFTKFRHILSVCHAHSGNSSNFSCPLPPPSRLAFESSSEESSASLLPSPDCDPTRARQDIHSISSLLKLYCRELPDPLCTFALYSRFLRAANLADEFRLAALREVVAQLPREHFRYTTATRQDGLLPSIGKDTYIVYGRSIRIESMLCCTST